MKPFTGSLDTYLAAAIASPDVALGFADLFTFTLTQTGIVLRFTNFDQNIIYNDGTGAQTWHATGPLVQGLKCKSSVGLDVDRQQITIAARPTDLVNGAEFLASIASGAFDGAELVRTRVFMTSPGQTPVGGVVMFKGRVSTVDQVGRTAAKLTIASDLVILDQDMPKNLYSTTCLHTLYDANCTLSAASFETTITAGSGSTQTTILTSAAAEVHLQGSVVGLTGANEDIRATVKYVNVGTSITILYPFPEAVTAGDTFKLYQGCAHTVSNCQNQFNNLINFRGFPYVPPPQMAL